MIKQVCKSAAIVAALVALSGCGAGSEGAKPSSSPSSDKVDAMLTGTWGSTSGTWNPELGPGSVLVLHIRNLQVELMGDHHCFGTVAKEDGLHVIRLKCDDGNTDRTVGRVYGLVADTMTVDWEGLGADSFRRAE
ncbi:hypothetical protein [Streptomyces lancefieldiae]|uniref:Lipoprotein n=1 Tax=Streptomyces lancefieldiae TaxID=3075520 RepID=A0ABU3AZX2_9ACTN|nr:hypothetical protein [Streptomyces sp. DSM 40712]MDT0615745.1 hypothetical protein [Streptomyces sp. DSM 40712]